MDARIKSGYDDIGSFRDRPFLSIVMAVPGPDPGINPAIHGAACVNLLRARSGSLAMNEELALLTDMVDRLFAEQVTRETRVAAETGGLPAELWQLVVDSGLADPFADADFTWTQAGAIARAAGAHAVPLPLVETLAAGWLLRQAGLDVPDGPLTLAEMLPLPQGDALTGTAAAVPWARHASHLVGVATAAGAPQIVCVALAGARIEPDANIAREPRDAVTLVDAPAAAGPADVPADIVRRLGAALRAAQLAGAAARVLDDTVAYANERSQFGRPIGKFQAIQQILAVLAGRVAAADTAVDAMWRAIDRRGFGGAFAEIAAAKIRAGEAATLAANTGHEVHGAIGFAHEHHLNFFTRRLWAWRAEYGGDGGWAVALGRQVAARGPDALWSDITARNERA
jgi:acyl-CoA dehydrogenase